MNEGHVNERRPARGILFFVLRFALLAPIVLYLWWAYLLPPYAELLGQISGTIINLVSERHIDAMHVASNDAGVLNSMTALVFSVGGRELSFHVSFLVDSFPGYVLLVLATMGLGIVRKITILLLGSLIILAGNVFYIVFYYVFAEPLQEAQEVSVAVGQVWLTLPFLLWIVLAYWDQLMAMLGEDEPETTRPAESSETAGRSKA